MHRISFSDEAQLESLQGVEAEWVILADHAEVLGGKLYLMGGGWETLTVNRPFPFEHPCAFAMAIRVPWHETNRQHHVEVEILDQDARDSSFRFEGDIEVGRPAGIPAGHTQRVQIAANFGLSIDRSGSYVIVVRIDGQDRARSGFRVVEGPGLTQR